MFDFDYDAEYRRQDVISELLVGPDAEQVKAALKASLWLEGLIEQGVQEKLADLERRYPRPVLTPDQLKEAEETTKRLKEDLRGTLKLTYGKKSLNLSDMKIDFKGLQDDK